MSDNLFKEEIINEINRLEKNLTSELVIINSRLDQLQKIIIQNENNCNKMSNHIDFVEKTYDQLQKPLFFFKSKVEYLMGSKPEIENK